MPLLLLDQLLRNLAAIGLIYLGLSNTLDHSIMSLPFLESLNPGPWSRYVTAVIEYLAATLLWMPKRAWTGAVLACISSAALLAEQMLTAGLDLTGKPALLLMPVIIVSGLLILWFRRDEWGFPTANQ